MENIPAGYRLILCISLTDLSRMLPSPAPFGGRFPGSFPILSSFPATAGFNPQSKFLEVQPNYDRALPACGDRKSVV